MVNFARSKYSRYLYQNTCPQNACHITHVHYAGSGQSIAFLANRNAELAVPPSFWPVNCIKIGGQVALLSCLSIYFLLYAATVTRSYFHCVFRWLHLRGFYMIGSEQLQHPNLFHPTLPDFNNC